MKTRVVSLSQIVIPHYVTREADAKADDRDRRSIQSIGIQQDLQVVEDAGRLLLIDGLRRLRIAETLGIKEGSVVIQTLKPGYDLKRFICETRLRLNFHRQDMLPSQLYKHLLEQKTRFELTNKELAAARGVDQDTITNYMAVGHYIAPVVEALDGNLITMRTARAFDGLSEAGQEVVFTRHIERMASERSRDWHREMRAKYPPTKFAAYYRKP